jgi:outer membrane autotransporter protein
MVTTVGAINGTFAAPAYQGAVPTALNPQVEYLPNLATRPGDPVVLVLSSPAPGTVTAAPANLSIFSEQLASLTLLADTNAATLLAGGAPGNGCLGANIPAVASGPGAVATASAGAAALGNVLCGLGGWIHTDGTFLGVNGTAGSPSYRANTAGFLAGVDRPIGQTGLRLGIAVGYDHRYLSDDQGASATADVARLGAYAIQQMGRLTVSAAFLYGHDWDTTHRPTGVSTALAHYGADEFSGGVQASLPIPAGPVTLAPHAGFRFASVGSGAFVEAASGPLTGFGVTGAGTGQTSLLPYARLVVSRDFVNESGVSVAPFVALGVQYQASDTQRRIDLTAADGTLFRIGSSPLDRAAGTAGLGVTAMHDNWAIFATYDATVAGNWNQHVISGGVRVNF